MRTSLNNTRSKAIALGTVMLFPLSGLAQTSLGQVGTLPDQQVVKGVVRDFLSSHPDFDLMGSTQHVAALIELSTNGLNRPVLSLNGFVVQQEWLDESGKPIAPNTYNSSSNIHANVLIVVRDPNSLSVEETTVRAQLEAWGYATLIMDDAASQGEVDAGIAWADAAYITMGINPNVVNQSLLDSSLGLMNASSALRQRMHVSPGQGNHTTDRILVNNGTHYITSPFGNGPLDIFSSPQPIVDAGNGWSQSIANVQSAGPAFEIYEVGDQHGSMAPSPGRRVQLPWNDFAFDMSSLNENGLTLLRRSVEWTAGMNLPGCGSVSDSLGQFGSASDGRIDSELSFSQWFCDKPGYNGSQVHAITLDHNGNGTYSYSTQGFHPLDNQQFGDEGQAHNYNFTYEINATFVYRECTGQFIWITGDDDAWVFIDDRLAVDLGGISTGMAQYVSLDRFGLVDGQTYRMHMLYAQRQSASSRFGLQTNLLLSTPTPELMVASMYD